MKKLALIDLSGLFWANWHATEAHPVGEAFSRTVEQVARATDGHDLAAVCCDAPPYKRREILPEYKAQREKHPPQALQQLDDVKARLASDGMLVWSVPGYEADDVIATATRLALADDQPMAVTIFSGDKDLLQLVQYGVRCVSPRSGEYDEARVMEKMGVPPRLVGDLLALMGDDSDNIPGLPGVGPKTAAELLKQFGSLESVLAGALEIKRDKLRETVIAGAQTARLARRCVELETDVPISLDDLFAERKAVPQKPPEDFSKMDEVDIGQNDAAWSAAPPAEDADTEPPESSPTDPAPPPKGEPTPPARSLARVENAVLARPVSFELGLEPQSIGGAFTLARGMFQSGLYSKFKKAEAIWAVMIRGREMGIGALTALDCFHVVEGKPAIHAHLVVARAKAHPDCEYFQLVDSGPDFAEYETKNKRNPKPTRLKYTLAEAKLAGLCPQNPRPTPVLNENGKDKRGNWEKRPSEMIRKTCATQLARIEYPDAALGLYAVEELTDDD